MKRDARILMWVVLGLALWPAGRPAWGQEEEAATWQPPESEAPAPEEATWEPAPEPVPEAFAQDAPPAEPEEAEWAAAEPSPTEPEAAALGAGEEQAQAPIAEPGVLGAAPGETGLISVDFKDADIRQVLRIISLKAGVDIVAGPDVEGLVTIKLTNVPWEQALEIILRTYGFTYERKERIVRVMTMAALEQEAVATEVFPLDYAKAKEVPDIVGEMLSDRGRIKYDERTNTVIVTDIPSQLFQIKEVIERLDQRTPQVLVETKVVETRLSKEENLGIDWNNSSVWTQTENSIPSSFPFNKRSSLGELGEAFFSAPLPQMFPLRTVDPTASSTGLLSSDPTSTRGSVGIGTLSHSAFQWTINMLKTRTDTSILSNPTVAVLNNQQAKIHIGDEYPIPNYSIDPSTGNTTISGYTSKNLGTVLQVTPHVNPSNEIVVDLKPEITTFSENVTYTTGTGNSVSLPRFTIQTAQTQVRIASSDTIAIGGLVKESRSKVESKVPVLGDLPIVGALFSNVRDYSGGSDPVKQDLLIFLTVSLLDQPAPEAGPTLAAAPAQAAPTP